MVKAPYFPIIYLRGYAGTKDEMEKTVATPYMGFNLGSTKLRQDHKGDIKRFIFESPLVRLMKDEVYTDTYRNGDLIDENVKVDPKSIWIFRYYEDDEHVGEGERKSIVEWAVELREFILRIRKQVCQGNREEEKKFRVYLVAHSMGGLICRCYLQNICRYGVPEGLQERYPNKKLKLANMTSTKKPVPSSRHLVDKVFTYGTPHNGIDIQGINVPDFNDPLDVSNFNRDKIRRYLKIPESEPANSLNGEFPERNFFCFVGSNYEDYDAFLKLSRRAVGPMSDGLVRIKNATVHGAPRAFAHRSHSGDYGIVNSEEGYQNLRRFLFGNWFVDAKLYAETITLPPKIQRAKDECKEFRGSYHIESALCVRSAQYYLHERKRSQWSADLKEYDSFVKEGRPAYLFSTVLMDKARPKAKSKKTDPLVFVLNLTIPRPTYEIDRKFWLDEHIEGATGWSEFITFYIYPKGKIPIKYGFGSQVDIGEANEEPDIETDDKGVMRAMISLHKKPGSFFSGKLELIVRHWN